MANLTSEEQLIIAQMGGHFEVTDKSGWTGKPIKKDNKVGIVVSDLNGYYRILKVQFNDGTTEEVILNNIGADPKETSEFSWLWEHDGIKQWVSF